MAGHLLINRKPKKSRKRLGKPQPNYKLDLEGLINMFDSLINMLRCQKNLRLCYGDDSPVKKTKEVDDPILFEKFHRLADELVSDDEDLLENCHRLAEKFARLKVNKPNDVAGLCEKFHHLPDELVMVTETYETLKINKDSQPDSKAAEDFNLMDISFVSLNLDEDENEFFKACQRSAKKIAVSKGYKESQEDLLMKPNSENMGNKKKDKLVLPFKPMEKNQIVKKTPQKMQKKTSKPLQMKTEQIEIVQKPLEKNTEDLVIVPKPLEKQEPKQFKVQKNPQRKLEFSSPTKNLALQTPKTFTPQTATNQKITENIQDIDIEEGEIIDDDCVLLEPPNVPINIDGDKINSDTKPFSSAKFFKACQRRAEIKATPKIVTDSRREVALLVKPKSDNKLLYSPLTESTSSTDISCIDLLGSPESMPAAVMPMPIENNDDSVILLEDSIGGEDFIPLLNPLAKNVTKNQQKTQVLKLIENNDDSVILLEDSIAREIVPIQKEKGISKIDTKGMKDFRFSTAEKKKVRKYNSNIINPTGKSDDPWETIGHPNWNKRNIVIDGSNVAFAHARGNWFSSEGLQFCLQHFIRNGHDARAVVPMFRRNAFQSSNPQLLDQLYQRGKIWFTPCKNFYGHKSACYDDRFVLQLAYERNAAVISNDNYRDLIDENPAFKVIVETRVIGYTWCDNKFMLPQDPYGRRGPALDQILHI